MKENIEFKSQKDLQKQYELSEVYANFSKNYYSELEYKKIPDLSKEEIEDLCQKDENFKKNYDIYLNRLRDLRRAQSSEIKDQKNTNKDEKYLERVDEFGGLRKKVLEAMQDHFEKHSYTTGLNKLFKKEDLDEAEKNQDIFNKLLREVLDHNLDLFFSNNWKMIKHFLTEEEIKGYVYRGAAEKSSSFLFHVEDFHNFFEKAEYQDLIRKILDENPNYIFYSINKKFWNDFFGEEMNDFVSRGIKERPENFLSYVGGRIRANDEEGLRILNPGEEKKTILTAIQNLKEVKSDFYQEIENSKKFFTNKKDLDEFKNAILRTLEGEKNVYQFLSNVQDYWGSFRYQGVFSETELKDIIQNIFIKFPKLKNKFFNFISDEEKRKIVLDKIDSNDFNSLIWEIRICDNLDEIKWLSVEDKKYFLDKISESKYKNSVLEFIEDGLMDYKGKEEKLKIMDSILEEDPREIFFHYNLYKETIENDLVFKELLKDCIIKSDFIFIRLYEGNKKSDLRKMFSKEEINRLIEEKIEFGSGSFFKELKHLETFYDDENQLKDLINKQIMTDPYLALSYFHEFSYLFEREELINIIENISQKDSNLSDLIFTMSPPYGTESWADILGSDFVYTFLKKNQIRIAPYFLDEDIKEYSSFIPENEREEFVKLIIKGNPPLALHYLEEVKSVLPEISKEDIMEVAGSDTVNNSLIPKMIDDFLKKYQKEKKESGKAHVLIKYSKFYILLNKVVVGGMEEILLKARIANKKELNAEQEKELLEIVYCFTLLEDNDDVQEKKQIFDIEDCEINNLKKILFEKLNKQFNQDEELKDDGERNFYQKMKTPVPLLEYYLQYKDLESHQEWLTKFYESILEDSFSELKFGKQGKLKELQEKGLLPKELKEEQYEKWQEDESRSMEALLEKDSDFARESIVTYLCENANHFESEIFDYIDDLKSYEDSIKESSLEVGKKIGNLKKEKRGLNKNQKEEIDRIKKREKELLYERDMLNRERKMLRILNLSNKEVSTGHFWKDDNKKLEPVHKIVKQLRSEYGEASFIFDNILKKLASVQEEVVKQSITSEDSSDPKILLEIGADPLHSCQNYADGSENECLLSYIVDPNTKVIILKDENNNLIARAILRLLENEDGQPALFLERTYSHNISKTVPALIHRHAFKKASDLNMELFISESEDGENEIKGFQSEKTKQKLKSNSSRSSQVYVDSAGGNRQRGKFTISNIKKVVESKKS
jgi:hypothetical protein